MQAKESQRFCAGIGTFLKNRPPQRRTPGCMVHAAVHETHAGPWRKVRILSRKCGTPQRFGLVLRTRPRRSPLELLQRGVSRHLRHSLVHDSGTSARSERGRFTSLFTRSPCTDSTDHPLLEKGQPASSRGAGSGGVRLAHQARGTDVPRPLGHPRKPLLLLSQTQDLPTVTLYRSCDWTVPPSPTTLTRRPISPAHRLRPRTHQFSTNSA